jgi:RNA polymerase sigma factor (sigma-70 family)
VYQAGVSGALIGMTDISPMERTETEAALADDDVAALVAAAALDDQLAWNALVRRFSGLLWSIARAFRLDDATAADAVQTTWLQLVDHLDTLVRPEAVGGWLATTMRRECIHVLGRASREVPSSATQWLDDEPADVRELDAQLLDDERDAVLWRAMGMLGERCQMLLRVLMASPAPTYADVSKALDLPIGSIGPTRQRCLAQLRRLLPAGAVHDGPGRAQS